MEMFIYHLKYVVVFFLYCSDIVLKVLAHNNYIGRIIGKGGNIINTIKKETDTKFVLNNFIFKFFFFFF
jgi:hypothetical protein